MYDTHSLRYTRTQGVTTYWLRPTPTPTPNPATAHFTLAHVLSWRPAPERHVRDGSHLALCPGPGVIYSVSAKRGVLGHIYFDKAEHRE